MNKTISLYIHILNIYAINQPNLASTYLAVTEVAPLAEYTPRAKSDTPPASAKTLSQSVSSAENPEPNTAPALL